MVGEHRWIELMEEAGVKLVKVSGIIFSDSIPASVYFGLRDEIDEIIETLCYEKRGEYIICPEPILKMFMRLGLEIVGDWEEV